MGGQAWQAHAPAKESILFRDHNGILELDERNLLARGMGAVGYSPLWQGPAAAGHGNRPWCGTGTISGRESWIRVSRQTVSRLRSGETEPNAQKRKSC